MAGKKFVKVTGLHNVFGNTFSNITDGIILEAVKSTVDANSILFITADATDVTNFSSDLKSLKEGAKYIWAKNTLFDCNHLQDVSFTGDTWIQTDATLSGGELTLTASHKTGKSGTFGNNTGGTADAEGESVTIKVPKLTFDNAGHLTSASDSTYKISLPTVGHTSGDHKTLTVKINGGTTTYNTRNDVSIDVDSVIDSKINTALTSTFKYRGKEAPIVAGSTGVYDGSTNATVTLTTGAITATTGDFIIDQNGIKEYVWNGSMWEEIGAENKSIVTYSETAKTGTTYEIGKITINGETTTIVGRDNNTSHTHVGGTGIRVVGTGSTTGQVRYNLITATADEIGGVKIGYAENGKNYPVELNDDGQAYVNVPWIDTIPTVNDGKLTLQIAGATKATHSANTASNTTFNVPEASASTHGVIKVSSKNTTAVTVNSESTTTGRYYPVELNSDGKAIVNIPWVNTTYGATNGVKLGSTTFEADIHSATKMGATGVASSASNRYYQVGLDAAGKLAVNVPWTDTAHAHAAGDGIVLTGDTNGGTGSSTTTIGVTSATTSKYGGIKIGYTENGKNYPVELNNNGQAFVNVPWTDTNTDTNTTYTLSGSIVGTTSGGASAVLITDTLTPSAGTASTAKLALISPDESIVISKYNDNTVSVDYTGVATADDWGTIG